MVFFFWHSIHSGSPACDINTMSLALSILFCSWRFAFRVLEEHSDECPLLEDTRLCEAYAITLRTTWRYYLDLERP